MRRWTGARKALRAGAYGVLDVIHPLLVLARGLGRLALAAGRWWRRTPRERRGSALLLAGIALPAVALLPYGPPLAVAALAGAATWYGRDPAARSTHPGERRPRARPRAEGRARGAREAHEAHGAHGAHGALDEERRARLRSLHEALAPCFAPPDGSAPHPLYSGGADAERAFDAAEFGPEGRLTRLRLRYPAWFADGDPSRRRAVERLLAAKAGPDREYRFAWDPERNVVEVTAPGPLPDRIRAQRFVAAPGEVVLGFTDAGAVARTVPVAGPGQLLDVPPVLWRTAARSAPAHLLAVGAPRSGTSALLRSVALQVLPYGDVVVVDGSGEGEHACLAGRAGALAVESSIGGATAAVEWAAAETRRRLSAVARARREEQSAPDDVRRPLWLLLDRPAALALPGRHAGHRDWCELLELPLRQGRLAGVTVVLAEHAAGDAPGTLPHAWPGADRAGFPGGGPSGLVAAVHARAGARVVLGGASEEWRTAVLGPDAPASPAGALPPGRGWARLAGGPTLRLAVPRTVDPYDEGADPADREAVRSLLPPPARAWTKDPPPPGPAEERAHGWEPLGPREPDDPLGTATSAQAT